MLDLLCSSDKGERLIVADEDAPVFCKCPLNVLAHAKSRRGTFASLASAS